MGVDKSDVLKKMREAGCVYLWENYHFGVMRSRSSARGVK